MATVRERILNLVGSLDKIKYVIFWEYDKYPYYLGDVVVKVERNGGDEITAYHNTLYSGKSTPKYILYMTTDIEAGIAHIEDIDALRDIHKKEKAEMDERLDRFLLKEKQFMKESTHFKGK